MPRRLLLLNGLLLVLAAAFVASTVWTFGGRGTSTPPTEPDAVPSTERSAPSGASTGLASAPGSYSVIVSRNLFSPTRSDEPATPAGTALAPPGSRPFLYGVVLQEGATSVAYLQDPATKRVTAYREGDQIAGATIKTIKADHIVLSRPDGQVDVRLHDPAKPRAVPAAQPPTPQPAVVPRPGLPGVPLPPQVTEPAPPGVQVPQPVPLVPRRVPPPNLLRQFRPPGPQGSPGESTH